MKFKICGLVISVTRWRKPPATIPTTLDKLEAKLQDVARKEFEWRHGPGSVVDEENLRTGHYSYALSPFEAGVLLSAYPMPWEDEVHVFQTDFGTLHLQMPAELEEPL